MRRAHLYLGLFLLPLAALYAVTAILFNHPTLFADRPMIRFGSELFQGTKLASPTSPRVLALKVIEYFNKNSKVELPYKIVEDFKPRYADEFLFGRVARKEDSILFLIHTEVTGGTLLIQPAPKKVELDPAAPFSIPAPIPIAEASARPSSSSASNAITPPTITQTTATERMQVEDSLDQVVLESIPVLANRLKLDLEGSTPIVTSIPDLVFRMKDPDSKLWEVRFNSLKGTVTGKLVDPNSTDMIRTQEPLTTRQRLLRLHTTHGYPDRIGTRWWWAIGVDAMSIALLGWAITGLMMWLQVKATRRVGAIVLTAGVLSTLSLALLLWQTF